MSSTEELRNTHDPLSITTDDARRLSEHFEATDARSAKIISAVESLAVASRDINFLGPTIGQHEPHLAQMALVNDLKAAVEQHPKSVTPDILKATQGIIGKMQRALGQNNAPNPELEAELQAEFAKIEPKIEQGTVTKAEADHLHSLEARAHGHTEKGGVTAVAQSVAAKRERALSLSDTTNESRTGSSAKLSPPTTAATSTAPSSTTASGKMATLSLSENELKDLSKSETNHVHARKGSAVEAH
ncbi:hypothetical protein N0V90_011965 [Kalmusia sp. IMI 367209]|nr:hypothetical protein N0V90_011965 [Kalmusia sp. IMI 367209]